MKDSWTFFGMKKHLIEFLPCIAKMDEISSVLPGLFIGGETPTGDAPLLRSYGITHVISIGQKPRQKIPGIKYTFVEAEDVSQFPIRNIFPKCTTLIDKEREEGGAVYVHCRAGVSRSAAVVIAYLMEKEQISYKRAFNQLKEIRDCIQPNEGFIKQLEDFEKELNLS